MATSVVSQVEEKIVILRIAVDPVKGTYCQMGTVGLALETDPTDPDSWFISMGPNTNPLIRPMFLTTFERLCEMHVPGLAARVRAEFENGHKDFNRGSITQILARAKNKITETEFLEMVETYT